LPILITCLPDKVLILQEEVKRRSLLGVKKLSKDIIRKNYMERMRNDEEADGIWKQNIPVFCLILTSFPFHIPQLSIFFPEIQDSKM